MHLLVDLLLRSLTAWIHAHPDAPFAKFMTASRGGRTDVKRMTRLGRLKSALWFLGWGFVSLAALALLAYLVFGFRLMNADNVLFLVVLSGLALWTLICFGAGIYLLVRVAS